MWYILYKTEAITFTMTTIILMFGFGMVASYVVSIIEEKIFLRKEMKRIESVQLETIPVEE